MARTWRDIFEVDTEIANDRRTNLYGYAQRGTMTIENAAREAGVTPEEFEAEMQSHGYRVPQTA